MAVPSRSNHLRPTVATPSPFPSTSSLRPRPPRSQRPLEASNPAERQSGLRASVLETALEIGFGTNDTVARWIFNNPLEEAEEEEDVPALTSASTATSMSSPNPFVADGFSTPSPKHLADPKLQPFYATKPKIDLMPDEPKFGPVPPNPKPSSGINLGFFSSSQTSLSYTQSSIKPSDSTTSLPFSRESRTIKAAKKKEAVDGYQSEGSAIASHRKSRAKLRKSSKGKDDGNKGQKVSLDSQSDTDSGFMSDPQSKRKRPKSKTPPTKSSKSTPVTSKDSDSLSQTSSRSAPPSPITPSQARSRRSFFRIKKKADGNFSESTLDGEVIPPVPAMPLPIAEIFSRGKDAMLISAAASSTLLGEELKDVRSSWGSEVASWAVSSREQPKLPPPPLDIQTDTASDTASMSTFLSGEKHVPAETNLKEGRKLTPPSRSFASIPPSPAPSSSAVPSPRVVSSEFTPLLPSPSPRSQSPLRTFIKGIPTPFSANTSNKLLPPSSFVSISTPITNGRMGDLPSFSSATPTSTVTPFVNRSPSPRPGSRTNMLQPHPQPLSPVGGVGSVGGAGSGLAPLQPNRRSRIFLTGPQNPSDSFGSAPRAISWQETLPPPAPAPTGPLPPPPGPLPAGPLSLGPGEPVAGSIPGPIPTAPRAREPPPLSTRSVTAGVNSQPLPFVNVVSAGPGVMPLRYKGAASVPPVSAGPNAPLDGSNPPQQPPVYPRKYEDRDVYGGQSGPDYAVSKQEAEEGGQDDDETHAMISDGMLPQYYLGDSSSTSSWVESNHIASGEVGAEEYIGDNDDGDDRSQYSDVESGPVEGSMRRPRQTVYSDNGGDDDTRYSRYTASLYSVTSVMDDKKSGEARSRFVRRVQALYGGRGKGGLAADEDVIPPVPKLPEALRKLGMAARNGKF